MLCEWSGFAVSVAASAGSGGFGRVACGVRRLGHKHHVPACTCPGEPVAQPGFASGGANLTAGSPACSIGMGCQRLGRAGRSHRTLALTLSAGPVARDGGGARDCVGGSDPVVAGCTDSGVRRAFDSLVYGYCGLAGPSCQRSADGGAGADECLFAGPAAGPEYPACAACRAANGAALAHPCRVTAHTHHACAAHRLSFFRGAGAIFGFGRGHGGHVYRLPSAGQSAFWCLGQAAEFGPSPVGADAGPQFF